jgi:CheY-like chemotaxis protein
MVGGNAFGRVTVPRSSVLIVSDVLLYRQGLASTLARDERLHVVAAVRGDAAVAALHASPARAVLLDMSGPNSLNVARLLRRAAPELRIIGFAISDDAAVIQCAEAGLAGFVGCDGSVDEIAAPGCAAARPPGRPRHRALRGGLLVDSPPARNRVARGRRPFEQGNRDRSPHRPRDRQEPRAQHPG